MNHKIIATLWLSKAVQEASLGVVIIETPIGQRKAYVDVVPDERAMEQLKENPRLGVRIREEHLIIMLKHLKEAPTKETLPPGQLR